MSANARHTACRDLQELASIASGLSRRSDHEIRRNIESLSRRERKLTAEVLLHLIEVERRKIFARAGYGSLFEYCTRGLKYSDSAAGRRIRAARCLRDYPQVLAMLCAGEVNVCSLSAIAGVIERRNCDELLCAIRGKSKREIDRIVAEMGKPVHVRDRVRPIRVTAERNRVGTESGQGDLLEASATLPGGNKKPPAPGYKDCSNRPMFGRRSGGRTFTIFVPSGTPGETVAGKTETEQEPERARSAARTFKIEFAADEEFVAKMEKVRARLSGRFPKGMPMKDLFRLLMDEFLERREPERREEKRAEKRAKPSEGAGRAMPDRRPENTRPRTRHIPAHIRDHVHVRDGGRCMYVAPDGTRCGSTWDLEIDHIQPFALGGDHSPDNLRLLCAVHNRLEAEARFGARGHG